MKTILRHGSMSFLVLVLFAFCQHHNTSDPVDYFGQNIPQEKAAVFAPGVISLENRWEGNPNFSPDGKEFYFNVFTDSLKNKAIYRSLYQSGQWTQAQRLEEIGSHPNWEPFISYSGNELFFVSSRPPGNAEWNGRIWKSRRGANDHWQTPELVDLGHETANGFWFPNHSRLSNTLFFGGNIETLPGVGKGDLHYYDSDNGAVNLQILNSADEDWDPFIAPDESYLMWASDRPGGYGGTDLYISFKENGEWGAAINMGEKVNSEKYEVAPRISSDGLVLFFDRPENGTQDIFWISSTIIEELKER